MIALAKEYRREYKRVFIVQDRSVWTGKLSLSPEDLVLTFDYGLIRDVRAAGSQAGALDHIVDPETMDKLHYGVNRFFERWHLDANGKDIFAYKELEFGSCFRQEIWNDIIYSARMAICFLALKGLKAERVECRLNEPIALQLAAKMGLSCVNEGGVTGGRTSYFFPAFQYVDKIVRPQGARHELKQFLRRVHQKVRGCIQELCMNGKKLPAVYIQTYHPTIPVILLARKKGGLRLYLEGCPGSWWDKLRQSALPIVTVRRRHKQLAEEFFEKYDCQRSEAYFVDGIDVGEEIVQLIRTRLQDRLPEYLATIEEFLNYFSRYRLDGVVLFSNMGMRANLVRLIGERAQVPSFLVINGFLSGDYSREGWCADWINAYGPSIKNNYFKNAQNVVCLGDPRMDDYVVYASSHQRIKGARNRIVIGASGYNSSHLNGYLCEEFAFLDDVLTACKRCIENGSQFDVTIKIRPNGYIEQYRAFCKEYFPGMSIEILDTVPMREVISKAGLYVSIYSQTHFEAALLGIPSIYYKKDDCMFDPPFDGQSELLVVKTPEQLCHYVKRFLTGENIGRSFLDRKVLEKYWGPLDGENTRRNLDFILQMVGQGFEARASRKAGAGCC